ncbi:hypothetical protein AMR41_04900 [Hapalosiphon sp. MRB220]|nr:hypothetical protein AMR41_04900 [Hapalosiphon sp. MRB220]
MFPHPLINPDDKSSDIMYDAVSTQSRGELGIWNKNVAIIVTNRVGYVEKRLHFLLDEETYDIIV